MFSPVVDNFYLLVMRFIIDFRHVIVSLKLACIKKYCYIKLDYTVE